MKYSLIVVLLAALILGAAVIVSAQMPNRELWVRFEASRSTGENFMVIQSQSSEWICIDRSISDSLVNRLELKDAQGVPVDPRVIVRRNRVRYHGVDVQPSYIFLPPHGTRTSLFDDCNFVLSQGAYRFKLLVQYYYCKDISSSSNPVPERTIVAEGDLVVVPGHQNKECKIMVH